MYLVYFYLFIYFQLRDDLKERMRDKMVSVVFFSDLL